MKKWIKLVYEVEWIAHYGANEYASDEVMQIIKNTIHSTTEMPINDIIDKEVWVHVWDQCHDNY